MLPLITMLVFGPVEAEQVREARHGDAQIRAGVATPLFVEVDAVAADDRHRHEELRRLEAGAVDDDVDGVLDAVVGDHGARA